VSNDDYWLEHNPKQIMTFKCSDCGCWVREDRIPYHKCNKLDGVEE